MTPQELREMLKKDSVLVHFTKADGSTREMLASLVPEDLNKAPAVKGSANNAAEDQNEVFRVVEILPEGKGYQWRAFKYSTLLMVNGYPVLG